MCIYVGIHLLFFGAAVFYMPIDGTVWKYVCVSYKRLRCFGGFLPAGLILYFLSS